jgi:hypothetical protein
MFELIGYSVITLLGIGLLAFIWYGIIPAIIYVAQKVFFSVKFVVLILLLIVAQTAIILRSCYDWLVTIGKPISREMRRSQRAIDRIEVQCRSEGYESYEHWQRENADQL